MDSAISFREPMLTGRLAQLVERPLDVRKVHRFDPCTAHMRPKRFGKHIPKREAGGKIYIYGKHALMEALRNTPKVIRKVFLAPDLRDTELRILLEKNNIPTAILAHGKGKELVGKDTAHQGVIATMDPSALLISFDEFLATLPSLGSAKIAIAILAEVQDPHNVGAIVQIGR